MVVVVDRGVLLVVDALLRLLWWCAKEGGLALMRVLAAWFSSTKARGSIPILSPFLPSIQLVSTFRITVIT